MRRNNSPSKPSPAPATRAHKSSGWLYLERILQALVSPLNESKNPTSIGTVAIDSNVAPAEVSRLEAKIQQNDAKQKLLRQRAGLLKRQNKELRTLNKSKDEFIALASHQLRTPATGVKQYVGMLLEGFAGELTAMQRSFLEMAYESNERQLSTINDLLQIARMDANKLELVKRPVDLVKLLQAVRQEQESTFKRRQQKVTIHTEQPKLLARVDIRHLRMALDNLLDNAGKYSPEDTTVAITAGRQGKFARIHIADQGVGIDPADFPKLFQKFSRLNNPLSIAAGGNGLGLYMVKKIVDAHGGTISVHSQPGKGTQFTLTLPVSAGQV